ncbi:MAG: TIGR02300 family protein [Pseudomonadota bacterium]
MPKEEWGVKRVCPATGLRFYDLNKNPIISPYTGEVVPLDTGKGGRAATALKPAPEKKAAETPLVEDDVELEADDADVVLDDDDDSDDAGDVDIDHELLEDDGEENVDIDEIADVPAEDEEN